MTLTDEQIEAARSLWIAGRTQHEIAAAIGLSVDAFRARLRDQLRNLPTRDRRGASTRRGRDPSEAEIDAACLAFRERWTPEQFEARR